MLVKTFGSAVYGVEAITITVEVNSTGTGTFYTMVGLPDNAVKESFQRVESTIKFIGYDMPRTRIVVNLAPADIKKSGAAFDLPMAIGILAALVQRHVDIGPQEDPLAGDIDVPDRLLVHGRRRAQSRSATYFARSATRQL